MMYNKKVGVSEVDIIGCSSRAQLVEWKMAIENNLKFLKSMRKTDNFEKFDKLVAINGQLIDLINNRLRFLKYEYTERFEVKFIDNLRKALPDDLFIDIAKKTKANQFS